MTRDRIYKALRDLTESKLPWVKYIDMYKGQFDNMPNNYPIPLPAIFFEIGDIPFTNLAESNQVGDAIISIYLYHDLVTDSFKGAEKEKFTISLLRKFDLIFQTFEGFPIIGCTPLNRELEYKPFYDKEYILFRSDFKTTILQRKKKGSKKAVISNLDLVPQYKLK